MHWKNLDDIIHDQDIILGKDQVESISVDLLKSLSRSSKPLEAAKIAYILSLLQLKRKYPDTEKALGFIKHLVTILKYEIYDTENAHSGNSHAHLVYVRKLAEHYFHHLMMMGELRHSPKVIRKISPLRKSNHKKLIELQQSSHLLLKKERKIISKNLKKHYLFVSFLLSLALFFTWTTFWSLMDIAVSQWVYTQYSLQSTGEIFRNALLLIFSLSIIFGFMKYQRDRNSEEATV